MSPIQWPLRNDRPSITVNIGRGSRRRIRRLLADTGAGSNHAAFELVLRESDCEDLAVRSIGAASLAGAYSGWFNVYAIDIQIPRLKFTDSVSVVGVPSTPEGFDGIACFKFLNRFQYGNSGHPGRFGLGLSDFRKRS